MACHLVEEKLLAFSLAAAGQEEARRIEEHLLGCRSCLAEYFAAKRALEASNISTDRPRAEVKSKLAAEFRRVKFLTRVRQSPVSWIAAGLAAAAATALFVFEHEKANSDGWRGRIVPAMQIQEKDRPVDAANPVAFSINTI